MQKVLDYAVKNDDRYLKELFDILKIPSISADPAKEKDVRRCGEWLVSWLKNAGFENVGLKETGGHPAVYADWLHAKGKPTVLVYGHYDVQPVDPLKKWNTDPFEPIIKDGFIYGRGTSDDKAQFMTHLFALEAWLKNEKKLPVNVKFFIEGEEEGGTGGTHAFVEKNKDLLSCDCVAISDTSWHSINHPTIVYALRGLCYLEVIVKGPKSDLHSGMYGGMLQNPLNAMAKIIAKLQDDSGKILVKGIYDDVLPLKDVEKAEFAKVAMPEKELAAELGVAKLWGEAGYTAQERNWARPSLDVHGIWGGFSGEGSKTVIPQEGGFKISTRLVANQDPEKIRKCFEDYIKSICPVGAVATVKYLHGAKPVMVPIDNAYIKAGQIAFEGAFGKKPSLVREGASIPITSVFLETLRAIPLLVGYGLPDDAIHAPNERFRLDHFKKGILCSARMYDEIAKI